MKKFYIFFLLLVVFALSYVIKIPFTGNASTGLRNKYYYGLFGVYLREPRNCGWWGCFSDDLFAFTRDKLLIGVNPFYFRYIGSITSNDIDWTGNSEIYRDNRNVIIYGHVINDSDPNTLEIKNGFAIDSKNIYLPFGVLKGPETASFQILGCGLYRDKNNIYDAYSNGEPLKIVDVNTFEMLWSTEKGFCNNMKYIAKDKNHFYTIEGGNGLQPVDN